MYNIPLEFNSLINLNEKTALVCGSSEGIGLASAILLSQMGAKVILLSRNLDKLQKAELSLYKGKQEHEILSLDLSNLEDIWQKSSYLQQQKIDILVNNAGGPPPNTTQNANIDEYLQAFQTHILASSELSKILLPSMIQQNWGRIINIISVSAKTPIANLAVSNTIRGAMVNWAKTLSNEVGQYGICVNNVLPGYTKTQRLIQVNIERAKNLGVSADEVEQKLISQVPMHRLGKAQEVASAVAFFASSLASYITGQSLCVDGGLSSWS